MKHKFENQYELGSAMQKAIQFAERHSDGHFALFRFTTEWKASFGSSFYREEIDKMASAKTSGEAVDIAISRFLDEQQ